MAFRGSSGGRTALATSVSAGRVRPAMADHQGLRLGMVFLLYVAQGIPVGLFFFAMPNWLSVNGASAAAIGLVATLTSLPWTLKFFNGFLMDRYAFLPMGRRRAWLIGAQTVIVAGLVAFALASPTPDQALLIGSFSFLIMAATTFQDVAIDGMAIDIVPDEERARANGFMFGGQSFGIAGGAAITGYAIAGWGASTAFLIVAGMVATVLLLIAFIRERDGERLLPWTPGCAAECNLGIQAQAWGPVFKLTFQSLIRRDSLLLAAAIFLSNTAFGMFPALGSMLGSELLGWEEARIGGVQGVASLVAGAVGLAIGGVVADRVGPKRFGIGILAAMSTLSLGMIGLSGYWTSAALLTGFMISWVVLDVLRSVALLPIAMRLANPTVGATQFAIYMACSNLGITFASSCLPALSAAGGYHAMLGFVAATYAIAIAFIAAARVGR